MEFVEGEYEQFVSKQVKILGKKYSKAAARQVARDVIDACEPGEVLLGHDHAIAKEFYRLRREENAEENAIFKVDTTEWSKHRLNAQYCFYSSIDNGATWIAFSVEKAIEHRLGQNHKSNVLLAFRSEVDAQIAPMRVPGMHVDHVVGFHVLLADFLNARGLTVDDIDYEWHPHDKTKMMLSDRTIANEWCEYHQLHAKLRVITAQENMSKAGNYDLPLYLYRKSIHQTYDSKTPKPIEPEAGKWKEYGSKSKKIESFRELVPNFFERSHGMFQSADDDRVLFTSNGKWHVNGIWGSGKAKMKEALRLMRGEPPAKKRPRKETKARNEMPISEWDKKFCASIRKYTKSGWSLTEKQLRCVEKILEKVGDEHAKLLFGTDCFQLKAPSPSLPSKAYAGTTADDWGDLSDIEI